MPRLAVIDAAAVDGRRRLVLVRRDNIEHLLMIGGPSDIVVEPNIVRAQPARDQVATRAAVPAPEPSWQEPEPVRSEPFDLGEPVAVPEPLAALRRVRIPRRAAAPTAAASAGAAQPAERSVRRPDRRFGGAIRTTAAAAAA